ncbi:MAG: hypothetical protein ACC669_06935 [bacterium]
MKDHMRNFVFITHNPDTFSNPMLVALFEELQKKGKVTLFAPEQKFERPDSLRSMEIHRAPVIKYKFSFKPIIALMTFFNYLRLRKAIKQIDECVLAGIDPKGLITAANNSQYFRSVEKLGYISFEIFFWDELQNSPGSMMEKEWEVMSSKDLDFVIISDERRFKLLMNENRLREDIDVFYVPVAPKNTMKPPGHTRRDGLARVVYSGSLSPEYGVDHLLNALESGIGTNLDLEFHSRYKLTEDNAYRKRIAKLQSTGVNIRLHDKVFHEQEEYLSYLSGVDVGICFYVPSEKYGKYGNKNIKYIGLSSGKLSYFAMMGIPVLMYGCEQFDDLNRKFDFGYVLKDPGKFQTGVENIMGNFVSKRNGCEKLYNELLEPEKNLEPLIRYLCLENMLT